MWSFAALEKASHLGLDPQSLKPPVRGQVRFCYLFNKVMYLCCLGMCIHIYLYTHAYVKASGLQFWAYKLWVTFGHSGLFFGVTRLSRYTRLLCSKPLHTLDAAQDLCPVSPGCLIRPRDARRQLVALHVFFVFFWELHAGLFVAGGPSFGAGRFSALRLAWKIRELHGVAQGPAEALTSKAIDLALLLRS